MNPTSKWTIALALWSVAAYAQLPSTNDTSDGNDNTGMGTRALGGPAASTTGASNTAAGYEALYSNTSGSYDTAMGAYALSLNTSGIFDTATGTAALQYNTIGYYNTASGTGALKFNTTGSYNTASGANALQFNTYGFNNVASGDFALGSNTTGNNNTGDGSGALASNIGGSYNSASGAGALGSNLNGSYNIAFGYQAGHNVVGNDNNIDIGNEGSAEDSGVIRIGTPGTQTGTAIAGIYGTSVPGGIEVVINSKGHLGVKISARRYKDDIQTMGESSERLYRLQPVTFRYKEAEPDGARPVQYGLVAEEVAKIYPELVVRNDNGTIQGVRYDELAPMLLNEVQKQQKIVATQAAKIAAEDQRAAAQDAKIASLERELADIQVALIKLQPKDGVVAQR